MLRHDTYNCCGRAVDLDPGADNIGSLSKSVHPKLIVENYDRRSSRSFIGRCEVSPKHRRDPQQSEEVRAHHERQLITRAACSFAEANALFADEREPLEGMCLSAPIQEIRVRYATELRGSSLLQVYQPVVLFD